VLHVRLFACLIVSFVRVFVRSLARAFEVRAAGSVVSVKFRYLLCSRFVVSQFDCNPLFWRVDMNQFQVPTTECADSPLWVQS
jgi:hypothetical protein